MNDQSNTTPMACCDGSREACRGAAADGGSQLPIVIRPRPLQLARLEVLLQQDRGLAQMLAAHPLHLHSVARAVHQRDRAARMRFATFEALASHLQTLL